MTGAEEDVAAGEAATNARSHPTPTFLDLPPLALRTVCTSFWDDPRALGRLATSTPCLRDLADEQELWRGYAVARFGKNFLPPPPPIGPRAPAALDGWVFYQGLDSPGEEDDVCVMAGAAPAELAEAAKRAGAEAFTSAGAVKRRVRAPEAWQRVSYDPTVGLYVRAAVAASKELPAPPPVPTGAWPPQVPGWVYYPGVASPGSVLANGLARHATLPQLLARAAADGHCIAVSTCGELKHSVLPQAAWRPARAWGAGLYVHAGVAMQMQLKPPVAAADFRALYLRLATSRLSAQQLDAVWLDGVHLSLSAAHSAAAGSASGTVLVLHNVCWLDVSGTLAGVLPGRYQVVWRMDLTRFSWPGGESLTLSASVEPNDGAAGAAGAVEEQQQEGGEAAAEDDEEQAEASAPSSLSAASGSVSSSPAAASAAAAEYPEPALRALRQRLLARRERWADVAGGVVEVTAPSAVTVRCASRSDFWKSGLAWDYVELRRLPAEGDCCCGGRGSGEGGSCGCCCCSGGGEGVVAGCAGCAASPPPSGWAAGGAWGLLGGAAGSLWGGVVAGSGSGGSSGSGGGASSSGGGGGAAPVLPPPPPPPPPGQREDDVGGPWVGACAHQ